MRRVIFAITVTIAGLVALLSFKSHFPERTGAAPAGQPPAPGGAGGTTAPFAGAAAQKTLPAGERAVLGTVANTIYGPVQVQTVVRSGKIVSVRIVQQPSGTTEDVQIGQYALPRLIAETLTAQSARVDAVSGATYTSGGYVRSLQSALERAAGTAGTGGSLAVADTTVSARFRHAEHVMGTVISFDVPVTATVDGSLDDAIAWLHWADRIFSPYRHDSDVSVLGRAEADLVGCAPEVAEVLAACAYLRELSGGYFTSAPGGQLDPSGYVKGWAVERAASILAWAGSRDHLVNGGGDVQSVGGRSASEGWRVGIASPFRGGETGTPGPGGLAFVVSGRDLAVATSGTAERGAHIIDPVTGRPATGMASITVAGPRLAWADAYATAAFAMGPALAREWTESLDGYEAFAILPDGITWQTRGFGAYLASGDS